MNNWMILLITGCFLAALLLILWSRFKTQKTLHTIEQMLDAAMNGTFTETTFDESRLSALETRFAHYLSASETSARNVTMEKDRIKSLIADISHQTKTPIANLLLYCELLKEENLTDSVRSNVDAIYAQLGKLRFLIDSLVKLSRLENGIITLSPKAQPLQPMLQNILEQYHPKARSKNLQIEYNDTDVIAQYDLKWTSEAIGNLVDNAIKYTKHGGITISVSSYEMFSRINITDTGVGIPETEQSKIFARFYRSEYAKEQEGVGIGLFLAREIISRQGGYIKVSSKPQHGTTFSVFLPR